MVSIQVLELPSVESPMEDLSYDVAGNISGGFVTDFLERFYDRYFAFLENIYTTCLEAGGTAAECRETLRLFI